jgi:hypothetical protein
MIPTLKVDRLIELITSNPNRSACECLNLWKSGYERELAEYDAQLKQAVSDNPVRYGLALYKPATQLDEGGHYNQVNRPAEYLAVTESDIPHFAKSHKLSIDELWRVLRGEQLEVGGWRSWDSPSWSASKFFDVRAEERREIRADLEAQDRKEEAGRRLRAEQAAKQVQPGPMYPQFTEYTIDKG